MARLPPPKTSPQQRASSWRQRSRRLLFVDTGSVPLVKALFPIGCPATAKSIFYRAARSRLEVTPQDHGLSVPNAINQLHSDARPEP
jgi:hypothetical protein